MASSSSTGSDHESEDSASDEYFEWCRSRSTSSESSDDGELLNSTANPTEVTDHSHVCIYSPNKDDTKSALGKWMVFRPFSQLDETWHMIRNAVETSQLSEYAIEAACTTLFYHPRCSGPGPKTGGVICVYTTVENVDQAGHILIRMVEHDIKYKTEEATSDGVYVWRNIDGNSVCMKTLYWNDGNPSYELQGKTCYGPKQYVVDEWRLNVATAPESIMSIDEVYGRWVVTPEFDNLTGLWHFLKRAIESGKLGPVEMVCPPKMNRLDPTEDIVFLIYTAYKNKEFIGVTLTTILGKDIAYQLGDSAIRASRTGTITYNHRVLWNDGEPVYVMDLFRPRPKPSQHRYQRYRYH